MSFEKGSRVRWLYDNRQGECTGDVRGSRVEVRFDAGEIKFIAKADLEPIEENETMGVRFVKGAFQGIEDYRRAINRYRLSGDLTDIVYSMSNSKTEFLPHQFIPVMKFLESYTERMLIADEVGLGKTIEAMYIWEELRARYGAQKLLIVAPAVLKNKWKHDIEKFFNIEAQIIDHVQTRNSTESLLARINHVIENPGRDAFVYIVSLEGIRTADEIAKVLDEQADIRNIFDLVIIDEAHYMRNSGTKSFKMGACLRDVSERLLLLSATPIQTSSANFYNLLCLLAPEEFSNYYESFCLQLDDLVPLVRLSNSLENNAPKDSIRRMLDEVLSKPTFSLDATCHYLKNHLDDVLQSPSELIRLIGNLKGKFFYDNYVSRTRKRDVFENRTERCARSVKFGLTTLERHFYEEVTEFLDKRYDGNGPAFSAFRLIARQRQMTSCMCAALDAWRHADEKKDGEEGDDDNGIWLDIDDDSESQHSAFEMPRFEDVDIERLKSEDSKYNAVSNKIKDILKENSSEKIVLFSFFRGTIKYLSGRLAEDGIRVSCLMGGVSGEEKTRIVDRFRESNISVLVSTEVGSEGIDLQFAKYEMNYDLPWNPMRLEQRIGRLDRIGQRSPVIYIFNAFCEDTIEDKILARLYERIETFRTIIGDLEEILGEVVKSLELDLFRNRKPTQAEIDAKFRQLELVVANKRKMNCELEKDAGYLTTYQRHILDNVKRAKDNTRRLTAEELYFAVKDYLNATYPGSMVSVLDSSRCATVVLSDAARRAFAQFVDANPSLPYSSLGVDKAGAACVFGDAIAQKGLWRERIDINHTVVRWMLSELKRDAGLLSGCDYLCIDSRALKDVGVDLAPGSYCYCVQNWTMDGVHNINELHYYVADVSSCQLVSADVGEKLMMACLLGGSSCDVGHLTPEVHQLAVEAIDLCRNNAFDDFEAHADAQSARNHELIEEQRQYVERVSERKIGKLEQKIEEFRVQGKGEGVLRLWRGKVEHVIQDRDARLERLDRKMKMTPAFSDVSIGIVVVED